MGLLYARLSLSCGGVGRQGDGTQRWASGRAPFSAPLGIFDLGKSAPGKKTERYAAPCNRYAVVITHGTRGAK